MQLVPETPIEFLTEFLPQRFQALAPHVAGKSSHGAVVLEVEGVGPFTFRLVDGKLHIAREADADPVLRAHVTEEDFAPFFVRAAELRSDDDVPADALAGAARALTIGEEQVQMVRHLQGTIGILLIDGDQRHRLSVTPGSAEHQLERAECEIEVTLDDYLDFQQGGQPPMQLFMSGKLRILGNGTLPMALAGAFV